MSDIKNLSENVRIEHILMSCKMRLIKVGLRYALIFRGFGTEGLKKNTVEFIIPYGDEEKTNIFTLLESITGKKSLFKKDPDFPHGMEMSIFHSLPIKIVIFNNEILAISSVDEKRFLLVNDLKKEEIELYSLEDFHIYLTGLLNKEANEKLNKYVSDTKTFKKFIENNAMYMTDISKEDLEKLTEIVSKIDTIITK